MSVGETADGAAGPAATAIGKWLAGRDLSACATAPGAVETAAELLGSGALDLPLPGSGATVDRLAALAALGRADLVLARLAEGHVDAVAILAELAGPAPDGFLWGVWAANPPRPVLRAHREASGWVLDGEKPWCSGAGGLRRALVTAEVDDGYRLFAVEVDPSRVSPVEGSWPAVGMAASDSRTVRFSGVPAQPVGGTGDYLTRPGFQWGAVGVAAVWHGGAAGVADALLWANAHRPLTEHALAHLGGVDAALAASGAVLTDAARRIDADPLGTGPPAEALARRARAVTERSATEVLDRVGRALGATPLALDAAHARRVADLTVYLRQSHAERDLQALGAVTLDAGPAW